MVCTCRRVPLGAALFFGAVPNPKGTHDGSEGACVTRASHSLRDSPYTGSRGLCPTRRMYLTHPHLQRLRVYGQEYLGYPGTGALGQGGAAVLERLRGKE